MSARNDGGPAFPYEPDRQELLSVWGPTGEKTFKTIPGQVPGMSLRDYFAGKELAKVDCVSVCGEQHEYDRLAKHCYRMADAMLKAREA